MSSSVITWTGFLALTIVYSYAGAGQVTVPQAQDQHDQISSQQTRMLLGKVSVDGDSGSVPDVTVVLECDGSERARIDTDLDGNFILNPTIFSTGFASSTQGGLSAASPPTFCVLHGEAPGYTSQRLYFSIDSAIADVGTIMLHSVKSPKPREGATVSVASLAAPPKARQAYEKGRQQVEKKNWGSACKYLTRAIELYPSYSVAWLALGRLQLQQNNVAGAKQSFERAVAQDNHFIAGYVELARVAATQKDWHLLADTTDHLVQSSPTISPKVWFFNSVAKFNMGNISDAEYSVTHGLTLDVRHTVPALEYIYAVILRRQGRYFQAAQHINSYLQAAPHAEYEQSARRMLADLEQITSAK